MTALADGDFAAYMHARWATLVRSAVLLGCSPHDAEDIAQAALTRCYVHWPRVGAAVVSDTVRLALDGLSEQHRTVVVLRFFADLSERQVAEILAIPPGTVNSRVSRALVRLAADPHLAALPT